MKINREQFNNIWFTSDWHFGHNRPFIVKDRGFPDIISHDEYLLSEFNRMVDYEDIVFHMGDLSFGTTDSCLTLLKRMKCKNMHFIMGNHDKALRGALSQIPMVVNGETKNSLGQFHELRVSDGDDRMDITLCHYPMLSWNKSHYGAWNICGHSHGSNPQSLPDCKLGKRLDVSPDVGMKFNETFMFTFEDVKRIMKNKESGEHH